MKKRLLHALVVAGIIPSVDECDDFTQAMLDYVTENHVRGLSETESVIFRCTDLVRFVSVVQSEAFGLDGPCTMSQKPDLTTAQINFFEVEIRNEDQGGVRPATLGSALDSLAQAPNDVIVEWCDDDTVRDDSLVPEFIDSVKGLVDLLGADTTLESLLPGP